MTNSNPKDEKTKLQKEWSEQRREEIKIVLTLTVSDNDFRELSKFISEKHFNFEFTRLLFRILVDEVKKRNHVPNAWQLIEIFNPLLFEHYPEDEAREFYTELVGIWSVFKDTPEYWRSLTHDWIRKKGLRTALHKAADDVDKKKSLKDIAKELRDEAAKYESMGEDEADVVITPLEEVEEKEIEWLWYKRIPHKKYSLIVGLPEGGKSFLTIYIGARVTKGESFSDCPEHKVEKGEVLLLTAEDDPRDTVKPRARWMGADLKKFFIIEGTRREDTIAYFDLQSDLPKLESALEKRPSVKLVIIDPISAYLPKTSKTKIDSWKDSDVRSILMPMSKLAEKYDVTILGVLHLNKDQSLELIHRISGSGAWGAAARSVWAVIQDKNDEKGERRFFGRMKLNVSKPGRTLAFKIVEVENGEGRLVFEDTQIDVSAETLIQQKAESPREQAKKFLEKLLRDGAVPAAEVLERAEVQGISERTLARAKADLKIESYQETDEKGERKWFWRL